MNPVIAITMGDYNGIGPEVILKAFKRIDQHRSLPLVVGHERVLHYYNRKLKTDLHVKRIESAGKVTESPDTLHVLNSSSQTDIELNPGRMTPLAGKISMQAVDVAAGLCLSTDAAAMVTAPISKQAIRQAGSNFPGHTEFLADKCGVGNFQMVMVSDSLRVAIATIHVPIREIAALITQERLQTQLTLLNDCLRSDFGITDPNIAVLGLNPHAGDGGVIGREEQTVIQPLLQALAGHKIHLEGPFAADGFFGNRMYKDYDAILAMYHDQGLIPFKTLSFGSGVNVTAGLPIVRTSPDHGTGFEIAGKNQAAEHSLLAAYELAVTIHFNRMRSDEKP